MKTKTPNCSIEVEPQPTDPPTFTLWIESGNDIGPDLLATAQDLAGAIATAVDYARLNPLVLIVETRTGEAWAVRRAA